MAQLTEEQIKDIKDAFAMFDMNNDGHINKKELAEVMRACGQNPTDAEIRDMIADLDDNNNGVIDYSEFETMMVNKGLKTRQQEEQEMQEAFQVFDRNGDGYITTAELRQTMCSIGEPLSKEEVDSMIEAADFNKDGKVDYKEFAKMMAQ